MTTLKANDMRSLAAENNKEELIEAIRSKEIDPAIQKAAEKGKFHCYWLMSGKNEEYRDDIRRSLRKDGFEFKLDGHILREKRYKISWL